MERITWKYFAAALACNIIYNLASVSTVKPSALNRLLHSHFGGDNVGATLIALVTICVGIIGLIAFGWMLKTAWNKIGKNLVQNEYELSLPEGAFLAVLLNILF